MAVSTDTKPQRGIQSLDSTGELLAALVAAAGVRRAIGVAVVLVFIAYLLVMAAAWLRFATDPTMFEEQDPEPSVVLKSRQAV